MRRFLGKFLLIGMFVFFAFSSCKMISNSGDTGNSGSGGNSSVSGELDFTSYPTNSAIVVDNNSSENLVLFKNQLRSQNMIGAIEANAVNHHIKKDPALFGATESFTLIAITEEQYNANKADLNALKNTPFARLYAFYNADAENNTVYQISNALGGDCQIILQNTTSYNVELRKNSKNGEVIGYAPPLTANTTFNVEQGDYTIFPVFIKYNSYTNAIYKNIPVYDDSVANESLRGFPKFIEFSLNPKGDKSYTILAADLQGNDIVMKSGSAYLKIVNNSKSGCVFYDGGVEQTTTLGDKIINSGREQIFEIKFTQKPDGSYPETRSIDSGVFRVGSRNAPINVPAYEFKADRMYTLTITGASAADMTLSGIEDSGPIDWDSMVDNSSNQAL